VGVERAMEMSACGRIVRVGLAFDWELSAAADGDGVMEERKRGHWCIAFESVLRRIGKYVRRVYWDDDGVGSGVGAG
jgi:hypothetical protein